MNKEARTKAIEEALPKFSKYLEFYTFQMIRDELVKELVAVYDAGHKAAELQEQIRVSELPPNQSER